MCLLSTKKFLHFRLEGGIESFLVHVFDNLFLRMNGRALNIADPEQVHFTIRRPPRCLYCSEHTDLSHVVPRNENGNGYPPYYRLNRNLFHHCALTDFF